MKLILPHLGEFGMRLRYHVPAVHYIASREPTIVCIERGDEALYPAAYAFHYVDSPPDDMRRGHRARGWPTNLVVPDGCDDVVDTALSAGEEWFRPDPWEPQIEDRFSVVVCPRRRGYGSAKNWDRWADVTEGLGYKPGWLSTFAAGKERTTYPVPAYDSAPAYRRPLDATIEAMRRCELVIATASGLAVLAMLCGAPLLLVTYRGLVAPGPQVDAEGRVLQPKYGPVPMDIIQGANHTGAPVELIDGWEHPERVVNRALELVGA